MRATSSPDAGEPDESLRRKGQLDSLDPRKDLSLLGTRYFVPFPDCLGATFGAIDSTTREVLRADSEADESEENQRGPPEVALGASRLGVIQDYLVQANFHLSQEDFDSCFKSLDSAWRALPLRLKAVFQVSPSSAARNRILNDFRDHGFEEYPIYSTWAGNSEKVTNSKYFNGVYPRYQQMEFYLQRARCIAADMADVFIRGFWDALELEGFDLPTSRKWSLEESIRAADELDEQVRRNSNSAGDRTR